MHVGEEHQQHSYYTNIIENDTLTPLTDNKSPDKDNSGKFQDQ